MTSSRLRNIYFIFLAIFVIAHHVVGFSGHFGFDDMEYARLAKSWADHHFDLSMNHFSYRWTIIFLTGLSYRILGMSDLASALPSMLVTLLTIVIIFRVTRKQNPWVGVIAVSWFALNQWILYYSDKIMTDSYITLAVFGSLSVIWSYRYDLGGRFGVLHGFLFSLFLFFGFLSKETIFLILPLLIYFFAADVIHRKHGRFWVSGIVSGTLLLAGYFLLLKAKTGNPWIRFEAIEFNSYISPCRYDLLPWTDLFRRISYELINDLILNPVLAAGIFVVPLLFRKRRDWVELKDEKAFFLLSSLGALLCANFMTTGFRNWVPLCIDVRHYLFLVPVLAVTAAPVVYRFFETRENRFPVFFVALFFVLVALVQGHQTVLLLYVPIAIIVFLRWFQPEMVSDKVKNRFLTGFILVLFIQPVYVVANGYRSGFEEIHSFVKKHFGNHKKTPRVVFADPVLKRVAEYYLSFDTTGVELVDIFHTEGRNYSSEKEYFLLENDYTWFIGQSRGEMYPLFMTENRDSLFTIDDSTKHTRLFMASHPDKIVILGKQTEYVNDFESSGNPFWSFDPGSASDVKYLNGLHSDRIDAQGYSATLNLPVSEIVTDSTVLVDVSFSVFVYLPEGADGQMVITMEDSLKKPLFWLGKSLRLDCRRSNEWGRCGYSGRIRINRADKPALFKVFIWNNNAVTLYADHMVVGFSCINRMVF